MEEKYCVKFTSTNSMPTIPKKTKNHKKKTSRKRKISKSQRGMIIITSDSFSIKTYQKEKNDDKEKKEYERDLYSSYLIYFRSREPKNKTSLLFSFPQKKEQQPHRRMHALRHDFIIFSLLLHSFFSFVLLFYYYFCLNHKNKVNNEN